MGKINSRLYILFLFCFFWIDASAIRKPITKDEQELIEAVSRNYTTLANRLIDDGVDVDITESGISLLMYAAKNNNTSLAKRLLEKGLDPNYRIGDNGSSVLDYGVRSKDVAMIELLVKAGAVLDVDNKGTNSVVAKAWSRNNEKIVKYLLAQGAQMSHATGQKLLIDKLLIYKGLYYGSKDERDNYQSFRLIKILDDYGIPIDNESLIESGLVTTLRGKQNLLKYMNSYRKWLTPEPVSSKTEKNEISIQREVDYYDKNSGYRELVIPDNDIAEVMRFEKESTRDSTEIGFIILLVIIVCIVALFAIFYIVLYFKDLKQKSSAGSTNTKPSYNSNTQPTSIPKPNVSPVSKRKPRPNAKPSNIPMPNNRNNNNNANRMNNNQVPRGRRR